MITWDFLLDNQVSSKKTGGLRRGGNGRSFIVEAGISLPSHLSKKRARKHSLVRDVYTVHTACMEHEGKESLAIMIMEYASVVAVKIDRVICDETSIRSEIHKFHVTGPIFCT